MDKSDECRRYKWSNLATNLLVSIWCHNLVQNQLKMSSRNQPIWESIARYMTRKGFPVTGLQCRTRIKNMLSTYHDAVKKNDPSSIEPYYEIFKKVLSNKVEKKKASEPKPVNTREENYSDETDEDEDGLNPKTDNNQTANQTAEDTEYQMEFLDVSNSSSQACNVIRSSDIKEFENAVTKAIDLQTKTITNAIKMQSQMIEKLLIAERERLEAILAAERENRVLLETRLDKFLAKLEENSIPQVSYVSTVIDTRHAQ